MMEFVNPFIRYRPEQLPPQKFIDLFVKEHTWTNALETPEDFIIYGSRGSGKSMLLTYLEFSRQLCLYGNNLEKFFKENAGFKFFGIMVHAKNEDLDIQRYELLVKNKLTHEGFVNELCMTDLILDILYRILKTFIDHTNFAACEQASEYINSLESEKVRLFCQKQIDFLDHKKLHDLSFLEEYSNTEILGILAEVFLKERNAIKYFANEKFQMRDVSYNGNYASFEHLRNFIVDFKKLLKINDYSFYILIDNGDDMHNIMQQCVNSLIGKRQHNDVCFKVAIKKGVHWNVGSIQWPHDYSRLDIDELYSTRHSVYERRIREIAQKRLNLVKLDVSLEELFPESKTEKRLLNKIKESLTKECEKEYETLERDKQKEDLPSKTDFVNNRVSKYAQAKLFRSLKKTGKSYAGFDNIVHLSSGIVRQFLDICSYMFIEEAKRTGRKKITKIRLKTQKDVIKDYADHFIDELEKLYKGYEKQDKTSENAKLYKNLLYMVEALGKHYKELLMDPSKKEPRVFTFTLKDPGKDPEIDKVLEKGVIENVFQSYWYSSKIGVGKYKGYAFNRRLCPRYGIDHTSFRGRIELTSADLRHIIKDSRVVETLDQFTRGIR